MKYVITIVEQLDRAAGELVSDHPINNRLALILIDNATELILHRQCLDRIEHDRIYSRILKSYQSLAEKKLTVDLTKYTDDLRQHVLTEKQRERAKGHFLDDRLKVLEEVGDITSAERRFVAIAHHYRNELYHVGLKHDDIIRAIAGHYFLLCCDFFARMNNLRVFGLTISSEDSYSDVARRYLPMRNGGLDLLKFDHDSLHETLAGKLQQRLPNKMPSLPETLAQSARNAVTELVESFEFLVGDNPFGLGANQMLAVVQWQLDLDKTLQQKEIDGLLIDHVYRASYVQEANAQAEGWKPRHTSMPSDRWLKRADIVGCEPDSLVAMDLYQLLRNDMSHLEEAIQSATEELDQWIQSEIDRIRGK